jgi:hypothetical protein
MTDARVSTDKAVALAGALKSAALAQNLTPRVMLRVLPTPGHSSVPEWHDEAAVWIAEVCGRKNSTKPVEPHRDLPTGIERHR